GNPDRARQGRRENGKEAAGGPRSKREAGWQLHQENSQLAPESGHLFDEALEGRAGTPDESLLVREGPGKLHGKAKIFAHAPGPARIGGDAMMSIERRVDLRDREDASVALEVGAAGGEDIPTARWNVPTCSAYLDGGVAHQRCDPGLSHGRCAVRIDSGYESGC